MIDHASLVFIGLSSLKSVVGFLLHLLRLQLVVLVHALSHLLKPLVFGPVLQDNSLPLRLHLLSEQAILLSL
jgi:uncharacterized membrane protein required for colicin V production